MSARVLLGLTAAQYHADPIMPGPSLSSSCATTIVNESPFHAWLSHPRLGGIKRTVTKPMVHGTMLHSLTFTGEASSELQIINAPDYKTKAAQQARDAAIADGLTPVLEDDFNEAMIIAADIAKGIAEYGIAITGQSEVAVTWEEQSTLGPVQCRGMMDHVDFDAGFILDLKNTGDASPRALQRHAIDFGYDIQQAAYRSAFRKLRPDLAGRESFTFLFVETLPEGAPRRALVTPVTFDGMFREVGERRWQRAVETWSQCLHSGKWPAYATAPKALELECPMWALRNEEVA